MKITKYYVNNAFLLLLKNKKIAEGTATAMDKFSDVLEGARKSLDSKARELRGQSNRSFWDRLTFGLMSKKKKKSQIITIYWLQELE